MPAVARDVIAAIATPPGQGALAVVRVSGPGAVELTARVFRGRRDLATVPSHTILHGYLLGNAGAVVDEVLAGVMRAPHSYTGEDTVELSCHGGHAAAQSALEALCEAGARPADPGEFTKRAFLNGKMDLSQAEAVAAVISSRSKRALRASVRLLRGGLSGPVESLREAVVGAVAEIEARLDFEDDLGRFDPDRMKLTLAKERIELESILKRCALGRLVSQGAMVALAGRRNVGKSSIFNRIVGSDRSIVSARPGTTRDYVEEEVEWEGVRYTLVDGAGFFGDEDPLEREAEGRARGVLERSDAVLLVVDVSSRLSADDERLAGLLEGKKVVVLANKADLGSAWKPNGRQTIFRGWEMIATSAVTGLGLDSVLPSVHRLLAGEGEPSSEEVAATSRQIEALGQAAEALARALELLERVGGDELVAQELRDCAESLGEITGRSVGPEVLDRIFSTFCVGK